MISKDRMPLAVGIAFVAFTTQFGGGFASGAQLYQYFYQLRSLGRLHADSRTASAVAVFLVWASLCVP